MARQVIWSEPAWDDREEIVDYIANDAPEAAIRLVEQAREAARSLAKLPHRGRHVPDLEHPEMREVFVGRYRLIYQVKDDQVTIHGLIHGARDLASLWEREGRDRDI